MKKALICVSGSIESVRSAGAWLDSEMGTHVTDFVIDDPRRLAALTTPSTSQIVVPPREVGHFTAVLRRLRRERYQVTVIMTAPFRGSHRVKLLALLAGWPRVLAVDQMGACAPAGPLSLLRSWRRRTAHRWRRRWSLGRAAFRLVVHQGVSGFGERLRQRVKARQAAAGSFWSPEYGALEPDAGLRVAVIVREPRADRSGQQPLRDPGVPVELTAWAPADREGEDDPACPYLLVMDSDLVAEPGWLAPLLSTMRARTSCGAVGAKIIDARGGLLEAGCGVAPDGSSWSRGLGEDPGAYPYNYVREVDHCSRAVLLRRAALRSLTPDGAIDGEFDMSRLGFALRQQGWSFCYQPAAVFRRSPRAGQSDPHLPSAGALELENAQPRHSVIGRRPEILVFDARVPVPERDSGSLFMERFLRCLLDLGYGVTFWPDDLLPLSPHCQRLQQLGVEVVYGDVCLEQFLLQRRQQLTYAIAYRSEVAARHLPMTRAKTRAQGYIAVDLAHLRATSEEARGRALQRERSTLSAADAVGAHSEEECEALRSLGVPADRVVQLPVPVQDEVPTPNGFDERRNLLFVGSLHPPNITGVRSLVRDVLPVIRNRVPGLRLTVVGEVCRALRDLEGRDDVELVGPVKDLSHYLNGARVFAAPLREGAGIKGKVLAALAAGVPLVTTSIGAEGIGLEDGVSAYIADHDPKLADAVVKLYTDRQLWRDMRGAGLRLFVEHWSAARLRAGVERLLAILEAQAQGFRPPLASPPAKRAGP